MFGDLDPLRQRPLPRSSPTQHAQRSYRDWPIDDAQPLHSEPLVSAKEFGLAGRNHYAHAHNPPYWAAAPGAIDELLVRPSVGKRLAEVDSRLKTQGLRLFLYDAWRPRAVQAYYHDVWTPREIQRRRPGLIGAALAAEVGKYWAAPTDEPHRPAPHATGAAVDLTIEAAQTGAALWMGGLFDDPSPVSQADRFEAGVAHDLSLSDEEARANRRMLYWLMHEAGFVGLRTEWWHFSWGDQMWAMRTGAPAALYGLAKPPAGFE